MSELKVGDRFYFPKQKDGDYKSYWGKCGVITNDVGPFLTLSLTME